MKLEEAYWAAREKLGMPYDEFDGKDWHEEVFRQHAVGGVLSGMREYPGCVEDGDQWAVLFDILEHPSVVKMIDACFQAAFVREANNSESKDEMSALTLEHVLLETYQNAYNRASGVLSSDDEEELEQFATEQVGWLAKMNGCEPD